MRRSHRVPLCDVAMNILARRRQLTNEQFIFPGLKDGSHLSDAAIGKLIKTNWPDLKIVPHGFRSTFRDWAENQTFSHRAIEYCLAHAIRNKTEAAYQRDDLIEKRRIIMNQWVSHTLNLKS